MKSHERAEAHQVGAVLLQAKALWVLTGVALLGLFVAVQGLMYVFSFRAIGHYVTGEANFDLMRKTEDAPNGIMDFLFIHMFEHLKKQGFHRCDLGMAPMSGIDEPENVQERVIKLAYERIRQFSHYKSLHFFKEKFEPEWTPMFLAYSAPFDLVYLPGALEEVMRGG